MSVYSSDSEEYDLEEGEIQELNKSYYILYFEKDNIKTMILYNNNLFTVYGGNTNADGEVFPFYAEYFLCQIDSLVAFLYLIYKKFDSNMIVSLYNVELDSHNISNYSTDYIYNKCGENQLLVEYPSYKMNMRRLYTLLEMIEQ